MRIRELDIFCDALAAIKRAAAYTAGDLRSVFVRCSDNTFISRISAEGDLIEEWCRNADLFFTKTEDRQLARKFIAGYGKGDLDELISYIEYHEILAGEKRRKAVAEFDTKGKLYTALGIFISTAAVLLLI